MDIVIEDLPDSVQYLASVIGLEAALRVVEERGGITLCVPLNPGRDHWLADLIGWPALQALSAHYGGEEVEIPRCKQALRNARALECFNTGMSEAETARALGMTERSIRNIRRRLEKLGRL